ncbi:hypothetical protein [Hydrocarboniphaga effusa]|uniref:hypothetical protein n=1 Tax=Hydrocarboniphaga effusa TaxID=243629 RepID=UPI003BADBC3E
MDRSPRNHRFIRPRRLLGVMALATLGCLSAAWTDPASAAQNDSSANAKSSKDELATLISQFESVGMSRASAEKLAARIVAGDAEALATGRLIADSAARLQTVGAEEADFGRIAEEIARRRLTDGTNGGAADALVGAAELKAVLDPKIVAQLPANAAGRAGQVARAVVKARGELQLVGEDGSAIGDALLAGIVRQGTGGLQADRLIRDTIQPIIDQHTAAQSAAARAAAKPGSAGIGSGSAGTRESGRTAASDRYQGTGSGSRRPGDGGSNGTSSNGDGGGGGEPGGPADDTGGGGGGGSGSSGSSSSSSDSDSGNDEGGDGGGTETAADDEPIEHLGLDGEFEMNGERHPTASTGGTPRAPGMEKERGSGVELSTATGGRLGGTEAANARRGVDLKANGGGTVNPDPQSDKGSGVLLTTKEQNDARRGLGMATGGGLINPNRDKLGGVVVTDRDLKELGLKGSGGAKGPTDSSGRTPPTQAPQSPLAGAGPIVPPSGLKNAATVSNIGQAPALKAEVKAGLGQ